MAAVDVAAAAAVVAVVAVVVAAADTRRLQHGLSGAEALSPPFRFAAPAKRNFARTRFRWLPPRLQ